MQLGAVFISTRKPHVISTAVSMSSRLPVCSSAPCSSQRWCRRAVQTGHDLHIHDDGLEWPVCSPAPWRRDRRHMARHPLQVSMCQGRSRRFTGLPACSPAPSPPPRRRHRGCLRTARRLLHLRDGVTGAVCVQPDAFSTSGTASSIGAVGLQPHAFSISRTNAVRLPGCWHAARHDHSELLLIYGLWLDNAWEPRFGSVTAVHVHGFSGQENYVHVHAYIREQKLVVLASFLIETT